MVIAHNMMSYNAALQLGKIETDKAKKTEKLSSGYRINRAADDAAGLAISEKMRLLIRGLDQGARNITDGVSYCQVADGALNEMEDIMQRLNELAVKAANGTNSEADREAIDEEAQALKSELQRICDTTKFNEDYIFRDDADAGQYRLSFSGQPTDLKIYNESYDATTGTAVYGGIVWGGQRVAWSSIDPEMYDAATGQFKEGTYSYVAADGTVLGFRCEDGSEPPEVIRQEVIHADENGVTCGGTTVTWDQVSNGTYSITKRITATEYSFVINGVNVSFTPDSGDTLDDVIEKLNGTKWESSYQIPVQEQGADVSNASFTETVTDTKTVQDYLASGSSHSYTLHADEDYLWLTDSSDPDVELGKQTWNDILMAQWGDGSTDISAENVYQYTYNYDETTGEGVLIEFTVIDEVSKDTVIDALDGMTLAAQSYQVSSHTEAELDSAQTSVLSVSVVADGILMSVEEENDLGRDFSVQDDVFASGQLTYSNGEFSVSYSGTQDTYTYQTNPTTLARVTSELAAELEASVSDIAAVMAERLSNGATNFSSMDLTTIVGAANITGSGSQTNLSETITIDVSDPMLIVTDNVSQAAADQYAGVTIDFSGLGTDYTLADLIGTGFNSTCETCNRHYSIEFTTQNLKADADWQSCTIDGETFYYATARSGSDYTFYIDISSMQGKISDGVEFTNAVASILKENSAGSSAVTESVAGHYTAYATKTDDATLYIFDNRAFYVDDSGDSIASYAVFEPVSYTFNTRLDMDITLYDADGSGQSVTLRYQYDAADVLQAAMPITATVDSNGKYVINSSGEYELYDQSVHGSNATRYTLTMEDKTADFDYKNYVTSTIYQNIADASTIQMQADGYMTASYTGDENANTAMVTPFETPEQIDYEEPELPPDYDYIRIQCSSNVDDAIFVRKTYLSIARMGLGDLYLTSAEEALDAIGMVDKALNRLSRIRSDYGAYQNRLEYAYDANNNTHENTQYAESQIRDTDMASEMVQYSKLNILGQFAQSLLAQANQSTEPILALLQ